MNLIIYKHYSKTTPTSQIRGDIDNDNGDYTVSFVSGGEDIMQVLKELIKTKYTA